MTETAANSLVPYDMKNSGAMIGFRENYRET